ncbi:MULTISPECIES: ATPase [unclassified Mycolicibacterium]|uniref:ATPase n=1 Tax=unclassified Mycolicibacterium TaxID=2636767 RepID=UPI002ED8C129
MRMMWAMLLAVFGLAATPGAASSQPSTCPPMCDQIPASAWIAASDIPLYRTYHWGEPAGLAVATVGARFRFEEDCATPPLPGDARGYAVSARALIPEPAGQWQVQAQVVHWRGETWRGADIALGVIRVAAGALRACQLTAPQSSPSITTDVPGQLAAVLSIDGNRVLHQYLLADTRNSTVVELAMWSTTPPQVPWPTIPDSQVFDAMTRPLCDAYLGSCR